MATAPITKPFLCVCWFMCSSLKIELALLIEGDADDLLQFSQAILAVHERLEILKLKPSPGPLGIDQIQKSAFSSTIPNTRRLQALFGLWQDRGAIQRGHLLSRTKLGQE